MVSPSLPKSGLERCYEAFERLKSGCAENSKFLGLGPDQITASVVSQEAGFDPGYLKKNRAKHRALIEMIKTYAEDSGNRATLSKAEIVRRERAKLEACKDELERTRTLLEQALAREVLLVGKLAELEKIAYGSGNLLRLPTT